METKREYLENMQGALLSLRTLRAYYAMEGAHRFMTPDSVQAAVLSSVQAAELTPVRIARCDSIYREAADVNNTNKVARR